MLSDRSDPDPYADASSLVKIPLIKPPQPRGRATGDPFGDADRVY